MSNILFTSAGKRTSLLGSFREALCHRPGGEASRVIAVDASPYAPTLHLADEAILGPKLQDPAYPDFLLETCRSRNVSAVIPCIDPDIPLLSSLRKRFDAEGIAVIVSDASAAAICNDKFYTYSFFRDAGLQVAPFYTETAEIPHDRYPLFLKPRCGSASAHTYRVENDDELRFFWPRVPEPIAQDFVNAPEITIDALLDLDSRPVAAVPRRRLQAIGGESVKGITIGGEDLLAWIHRVLVLLGENGARGPVTLQAFLTEPEPTMSEVNLRFGGGAPLAFAAGADYPGWLLQMLHGESFGNVYGRYQTGLAMTRYYSEVFFEPESCG